jgi:hypothetical protein
MLYRANNTLLDSETDQRYTVSGTPRDHFLEGSARGVYSLIDQDGNHVIFSRETVESERFTLVAA